ncbi:hypothetical protein BC567DRAFT_230683 [Phyllosticta citribraziliensis]
MSAVVSAQVRAARQVPLPRVRPSTCSTALSWVRYVGLGLTLPLTLTLTPPRARASSSPSSVSTAPHRTLSRPAPPCNAGDVASPWHQTSLSADACWVAAATVGSHGWLWGYGSLNQQQSTPLQNSLRRRRCPSFVGYSRPPFAGFDVMLT